MDPIFLENRLKGQFFLKNVFPSQQKSYYPPTKTLILRPAEILFRHHLREKIADSSLKRVTFFLGNQVPFILIFKLSCKIRTLRWSVYVGWKKSMLICC